MRVRYAASVPRAFLRSLCLMEVAGRMCRQLICDTDWRMRVGDAFDSIKQIEISRVIFGNHLPLQTDHKPDSKRNSIDRVTVAGTSPGSGAFVNLNAL